MSDVDAVNVGPSEGGASGVSESKIKSGQKLPEGDQVQESPPAHSSNLSPLAQLRNAELGVDDDGAQKE